MLEPFNLKQIRTAYSYALGGLKYDLILRNNHLCLIPPASKPGPTKLGRYVIGEDGWGDWCSP